MVSLKDCLSVTHCGVCDAFSLDLLWDLPKHPLTEKYGLFSPEKALFADQRLLICKSCGHVQLGMQIAPEFLYSPGEYSFRTSQSKTARAGSELFLNFFHSISQGRLFRSLLDIGGNDRFLAKRVPLESRFVIDPICSNEDGQTIDNTKIIGKFIEEVDFKKEGLEPDLIFCRHVLEHVARPKQLLLHLFEQCAPEALYIFEIPCFENLVEANRFDAIFHQHYHYFDLSAFKTLIAEAGGTYLSHLYNRQGSCGGALLIAFRKARTAEKTKPAQDTAGRKCHFQKAISAYCHQMELLSAQLKNFNQNIYGYWASLMLATLAYHLQTDFSELVCVLDDDQEKDNLGYQNVPVIVRYSNSLEISPNSNFIITSLENARPIFKRITEFSPRRILIPLVN